LAHAAPPFLRTPLQFTPRHRMTHLFPNTGRSRLAELPKDAKVRRLSVEAVA
jgi:hypothetical protein